MATEHPDRAGDGQAWEANACFTIKAENEERVNEISRKLDAYAQKIGAGRLFCDYSGPQPTQKDNGDG